MKQGQEIAYETGKEQSTYVMASSVDYDRHLFHLVTEAFSSLPGHPYSNYL